MPGTWRPLRECDPAFQEMSNAGHAWADTPWWRPLRWLRARRRYARAHLAFYGPGSAWDGNRAARPLRWRA